MSSKYSVIDETTEVVRLQSCIYTYFGCLRLWDKVNSFSVHVMSLNRWVTRPLRFVHYKPLLLIKTQATPYLEKVSYRFAWYPLKACLTWRTDSSCSTDPIMMAGSLVTAMHIGVVLDLSMFATYNYIHGPMNLYIRIWVENSTDPAKDSRYGVWKPSRSIPTTVTTSRFISARDACL